MSFSQGCLFIEAFEANGTKEFRNAQNAGTPISYMSGGTTSWTGAGVKLLRQDGTNFSVPSGVLLPVFPLSGSGSAGTVTINMTKLLALSQTNFNKVWEAFTCNGLLEYLQSTSQGTKPIRVALRALRSANYSLTSGTRTACPNYVAGVTSPNFNFTGESAGNYAAEFEVPEQPTVPTTSFAPDDFSIPNGNLPSPGTYNDAVLALTRSFSTDSSGNNCNPYQVPSNLPSVLVVS